VIALRPPIVRGNSQIMPAGTRFRIFAQPWFPGSNQKLETVWLSPPPGTIGPGPSDTRMYVIEPLGPKLPYGVNVGPFGSPYIYLPPWGGPMAAPAMPDPAGHFDHLEPGAPGFEAAHAFGCARFVLDAWETYLGLPAPWHFAPRYDRLEITLIPHLDNATAGYGFMELGALGPFEGGPAPFSLSFDVIAHELGHLFMYREIGLPDLAAVDDEFFGFHESAADLVALVAVLHFDSVIDRLLATTRGNLYALNELNRFGELSDNDEIRLAGNGLKLSDFSAGWSDEHDLSLPFTGAMFDVLVDVFHQSLLARGLIGEDVEELVDETLHRPEYGPLIQSLFDRAYGREEQGFRDALLEARDYVGHLLAESWRRLYPSQLTYASAAATLLDVDRDLTGGIYQETILECVRWREIGAVAVGPRLSVPGATSHAFSARTITPEIQRRMPRPSYRERWAIASQGRRPTL
jgi:hypothetical protein